jgi:hypothetical protein
MKIVQDDSMSCHLIQFRDPGFIVSGFCDILEHMFDDASSPQPPQPTPKPAPAGMTPPLSESNPEGEKKLVGLTPISSASSSSPDSPPRPNVIDQHVQATAAPQPLTEGFVEDESAHRRNILIIASVLIVVLFLLILGGFFAVNLLFPSSEPDLFANVNTDLENEGNENQSGSASNLNATNINEALAKNDNSVVNAVTNTPVPINPSSDADADGLTYAQELLMGTDANDPDTDNDSYLDGTELQSGYNPLGEGVVLDHDGDGTDDAKEVFAGTDPYDARE